MEESIRYGIVETANRYKVSVNNICRWRRSCERKRGAGRKITNLRMEIQLIEWLKGVDRIPLRKEIQESARRLAGEQSGFKASKGWF